MSRVLTGDKLIDSVRKRTMTPDDTSIFTDQDILDIVNEELDAQVLMDLLALHEEHLTVHIDIPKNADGVYDIPYRAIGNKIRDVSLVSTSDYIYELSQISIGELPDHNGITSYDAYLDRFYVESNQIKLINPSRSYGAVRIYYYIRPNVLTKVQEAGIISSIDSTSNPGFVTFGLSQVGKKFSIDETFDIVGKRTPNKIKEYDIQPTTLNTGNAGSITFNISDIPNLKEIIVGDYVTLAEQSPVPNIPTEMHPVLAQAAAIHLLEALGDTEALGNAQMRMEKMSKSVQSLVDDRVELAPKKIKPRHGALSSILRLNRGRRGRY